MLQTIREKLTGWFAIFILGAIGLALVVSFGNIDTGFSGGAAAASVNGEDIAMNEFRQLYQQQRQQWEANYRTQLPEGLAEEMADSVIQSLVRNRVVSQYVRDQGYRVNDDEVIQAITENTVFYVGGSFSQPAYEQLLAAQGMSSQRFEFEQRQSMQISQFIEGIGYTSFFTPAEFRRYIELDGENRDLDYIVLPAGKWSDEVALEQDQVASYYAENPDQFRREEAVSLAYIEIDFAAIAADVDVSAEEAREYFAANPGEFRGPDERRVRHILIPFGDDEAAAEAQAAELLDRIAAGDAFETLAREFSADSGTAGNGGDLGWLGAGDSPAPEFEDALLAMNDGDISAPVRTEYGFHLIRLDGVRTGSGQDFAEVQDELLARLREDAAAEIYSELVDELDERALESLDGLAPVAAAMDLELKTVEEFTRSGGMPLGYNPQLVDTVFSLEVLEDGENSPVLEIEEGRAVVVEVTDHRLPEVLPLEDVREQIVAQLRRDEAIVLAAAAGETLISRLNAGEDADALAGELELDWSRPRGLRRGSPDVPADLSAAVFRAPRPPSGESGPYTGQILASGDFAVYRIAKVNPGQPGDYSVEDRNQRKDQLASRLGGAQASAVVEALVDDADIRITPDLTGADSGQL